jgi:N-acyl-D-amino-acid deacylase
MISFSQGDEVVDRILAEPYVNICTDGLLGGRPHPRAYGSFPRILGRYVRERKRLSLEEAIRRMTSQAAEAMHLKDRGRVAAGLAADLVVFDPVTIADRATFEEPTRLADGVEHVIVRGTAVVSAGRSTHARPGRVVRK